MEHLNFGSNLKMLRKKHSYSRQALADRLSYSKKAIEKWEFSRSLPPVETICKLADIFDVTVDSLLFEKPKNINYLLGIDGGGTKTEFLLTDLEGNQIRRLVLGSSNPNDIGIADCKQPLEDGIRRICEDISLREVSVFAGLSGSASGNYGKEVNELLSEFSFGCFGNGSDTENALELSLGDSDGLIVIMGTGIVAIARHGEQCERIGGWGYLIDKGGSGYNLGADVLDCAYKNLDGRGGSALIKEMVEGALDKPLVEAISDIYRKGKAYIASFAPIVFSAYEQGDGCADEILHRNMNEVALLITTGLKRFEHKCVPIVISGGLCRFAEVLKPILSQYVGDTCTISFKDEPMVRGAILLAKRQLNNKGDE